MHTSGVTRGEQVPGHGMRVVSHGRGNPDTEVDRRLNIGPCSPTLLVDSLQLSDSSMQPHFLFGVGAGASAPRIARMARIGSGSAMSAGLYQPFIGVIRVIRG